MLPFIGCVSSSYFSGHFFNFPRHTECMTIPLSAPVEKIEIIRLFGATNTNRKNREQILLPFQYIITWLYFLCYVSSSFNLRTLRYSVLHFVDFLLYSTTCVTLSLAWLFLALLCSLRYSVPCVTLFLALLCFLRYSSTYVTLLFVLLYSLRYSNSSISNDFYIICKIITRVHTFNQELWKFAELLILSSKWIN